MQSVVLSLSGGLDSTTMMAYMLAGGRSVFPVFFIYPSAHNKLEMQAAVAVASHYKQTLRVIDATSIFAHTNSGLFTGDIAHGEYTAGSMAKTVVPGRNLIFASILASIAQSLGEPRTTIALGIHAGDHALYADCREDWAIALSRIVDLQTEGAVTVSTPFSAMTKADIVKTAIGCGVPIHLTRSCYSADGVPCGECGTCIERKQALWANGIEE